MIIDKPSPTVLATVALLAATVRLLRGDTGQCYGGIPCSRCSSFHLTITLGISTVGYTALGIGALPADLHAINWAGFADTPSNPAEGDFILQICTDSAYLAEHVLRRIEHTMAPSLTVAYALPGEQRSSVDHAKPPTADTARALTGFHDGLSNLNPNDADGQQLIFMDPTCTVPIPVTPPAGPQPVPGPGQVGYGSAATPPPNFPPGLPAALAPEQSLRLRRHVPHGAGEPP